MVQSTVSESAVISVLRLGKGVPALQQRLLSHLPVKYHMFVSCVHLADVCVAAQANLQEDVLVNQNNEYEVLQLLLAECRDRLTAYGSEVPKAQYCTMGCVLWPSWQYPAVPPGHLWLIASVLARPGICL